MSDELEVIVREMFEDLDKLDVVKILDCFSQDVQWVDEFTEEWKFGKSNLETFFSNVTNSITNMKSKASNFRTVVSGENALVTFMLEQTYTHDGQNVDLKAPTTMAFIRENGTWKVSLLHSIPL